MKMFLELNAHVEHELKLLFFSLRQSDMSEGNRSNVQQIEKLM